MEKYTRVEENSSRISVLETKCDENAKIRDRHEKNISEILQKIEDLKKEMWNTRCDPDIDKKIKELELQVDSIRLELPEMRLTKKLVMSLVAFILTAFLTLLWNTTISSKHNSENMDQIAKHLLDEYKKGGDK